MHYEHKLKRRCVCAIGSRGAAGTTVAPDRSSVTRAVASPCRHTLEVGELRLFNNNTELVTQHTGQAHIAWHGFRDGLYMYLVQPCDKGVQYKQQVTRLGSKELRSV